MINLTATGGADAINLTRSGNTITVTDNGTTVYAFERHPA